MSETNNSAITNPPSEQTVRTIAASEIPRLAPKLKQYLRRPDPTWPDIVAAADGLRRELGVSKSLWREACLAMGRDLAAVAIAVITTKEPGEVRNPEGYFRGLLAKHIAGELHLERTVWRLRCQGKQMTTPVTEIQEPDDDPSPAVHQLRQYSTP
jgi:replication initiation protein RepC